MVVPCLSAQVALVSVWGGGTASSVSLEATASARVVDGAGCW